MNDGIKLGVIVLLQESTLHLVLRLRGGAKKRKKKSYTTPKKNKHKRKKVKLAVLKYYKVGTAGSTFTRSPVLLQKLQRCLVFAGGRER